MKRKWSNTLKMLSTPRKRCLLVNASMCQASGRVVPNNIGDDLNCYLLEEMTGRRVFNKKDVWNVYCLPIYMCIGSILNARWIHPRGNIVWGAGARNDIDPPRKRNPKKVVAVRGPKTRELLLKHGVSCPEIYGDPVLLLPRFYRPSIPACRYKVGIVPHIYDLENPLLKRLSERYPNDVKIVDVKHYTNWHDVIYSIVSCEIILSSSLHGLIIADAYNIPNKWVKFSDDTFDGAFKYQDYMLSVGRQDMEPLQMTDIHTLDELYAYSVDYRPIDINLDNLLAACPFL